MLTTRPTRGAALKRIAVLSARVLLFVLFVLGISRILSQPVAPGSSVVEDAQCLATGTCATGTGLFELRKGPKGDILVLPGMPKGGWKPPPKPKDLRPVVDRMQELKDSMQGKLKGLSGYTREEKNLRAWKWRGGLVEPHESLTRLVASLTPDELSTRGWLIRTRPVALEGQGIGLGRDLATLSDLRPDVEESSVLAPFSSGSLEKWQVLKDEETHGHPAAAGTCPGGEWQDYQELHSNILHGVTDFQVLEDRCPDSEPCGGLADRILGIATSFLYSMITRRALVVHWDNPLPPDLLFDTAHHIDWSYPYFASTEKRHKLFGDAAMKKGRDQIYAMQATKEALDEMFMVTKWFELPARWLRLLINRGLVIRSFNYPALRPRLKELNLNPQTAFSCLINYLIRPRPAALLAIQEYESVFALPSIFSIGIQVRTGDKSMASPKYDALNTVKRHQAFFTCAEQVAKRYADPEQRVVWYLISDSATLKREALEKYPDKVVVSGLGIHHTDPKLKLGEGDAATKEQLDRMRMDGAMDSVVESWSFAATDFKVITEQSGFGKIAAFLRAKPDSTITIFPEFDDDIQEAWRREPGRENIDCGLDSALVSFDTLASQWSLG